MSKALAGVRILDFTHVQSGPTCTQLLAWFGADVIKVERAGEGDATRGQLRDIPGVDSLYFTMLNHNKRSITIDTKKKPKGKEVLDDADQDLRRAGRELRPRRARPHGHHLGAHPGRQPAHDRGLSQGLRPRPVRGLQGLRERGAVRRRLGLDHRRGRRRRRWSPARRSATAAPGCTWRWASSPRCSSARTSGRGQKVLAPMQDAVLNLCRVKLRDQQRLERTHTLHEFPQYPDGKFGDAVPRAGNASGGGQPGAILKCKGWETDPNAYIYFITQAAVWPAICKVIGEEELDRGRGLQDAAGAAAAPEADFPPHRAVDDDEGQVRSDGHLEPARHPLRPDPVDEGDRLRAVAARFGHRGRGRSPDAWQVPHGRQPHQAVATARPRSRARRCWASTPTRCWRSWASRPAPTSPRLRAAGAV